MTTPSPAPVTSSALNEKAREALAGLGALVFWEMSDTKITPADLRSILTSEGIQIEVPDIDPESAVRRAARTWATGRAGTADKYRGDVVDTGNAEVKVCILHREETQSGAKKAARWETVEAVSFDLATRQWSATAWTPETRGFVALADEFIRFHDHNFIRPNVVQKRLAEMRSFSLKASSGLWYVTQDRMTDLAALQRVVSRIGHSQMFVIHVGASDSSREAIQTAARSALAETLAELEGKLESWIESTRKIRTDAIDTTMGEFQELIERADLYQGALQVRMEDLAARISAARDRARAIIDGNLSSHSDPATKPLGKRALQVLEAVEAAFPAPSTFTVKALEDVVGASPGTLQTHLRDLTRMGKVHREGRDESGAILFQLGPSKDPEGEAAGMDDVSVSEEAPASTPAEEVALLPAKEREEAPPVAEPAPEATVSAPIADAFGLGGMPGVTVQEEPVTAPEAEVVAEPEAPVRSTVVFPTDEELAAKNRDQLRAVAASLAEQGVVIPRASKLGRADLAQAIAAARDGEAAA